MKHHHSRGSQPYVQYDARVYSCRQVDEGCELIIDRPYARPEDTGEINRGSIGGQLIRSIHYNKRGKVVYLLDKPVSGVVTVCIYKETLQRTLQRCVIAQLGQHVLQDMMHIPVRQTYGLTSPGWVTIYLYQTYLDVCEVQTMETTIQRLIEKDHPLSTYLPDYKADPYGLVETTGDLGSVHVADCVQRADGGWCIHLQAGTHIPRIPQGHRGAFHQLAYHNRDDDQSSADCECDCEIPQEQIDDLLKRKQLLQSGQEYHWLAALLPGYPRRHLHEIAYRLTNPHDIVTLASPVPDSPEMSSFVVSVGEHLRHPVVDALVDKLTSKYNGKRSSCKEHKDLVEVTHFLQDDLKEVLDNFGNGFISGHPLLK